MPRQSTADEEKARDALVTFLLSLNRAPLTQFLRMYAPKGLSPEDPGGVTLETEVATNLGSRVDLVISRDRALLFVEVKVDAVEHVGQYEKYTHYFQSQGYTVTAAGLINRQRQSRTRDNAAFFEALGVTRLTWGAVLESFEQHFGGTSELHVLRNTLKKLNPTIGEIAGCRAEAGGTQFGKNSSTASGNRLLCQFFQDLLSRLTGREGTPWQDGNSPYCLAFGKPSWREKFQEEWVRRAFICYARSEDGEPCFKFSAMLWNRTWTANQDWFRKHRIQLAEYFTHNGFDVGRNAGSSWHRRIAWGSPYDTVGLKYVNAFWHRIVPLEPDWMSANLEPLLAITHKECDELTSVIDAVEL